MALFPSPLERNVAAALLLLSKTKRPSPSPISHSIGLDCESPSLKEDISSKSSSEEKSLSLFSTSSKSKSSVITSDGSSKDNRAANKHRIVTVVPRSREMKFKVARKRRSKVCWSTSDDQKVILALPATSRPEPAEASCLSSTTTAASSARSHSVNRGLQMYRSQHRKKLKSKSDIGRSSASAHLRHQAEAILKLLARGSSSEVRIRQQLGDSPDTSKALRMLLKKEQIKRSGMGGRFDPYIYKLV